MSDTELAVVGAGPAGYGAAFRAAELGLRVTLVDRAPRPGGVCLHRGCIPSKALLHAAHLMANARRASAFGIRFAEPEIDLAALRRWKDDVVSDLASGLEELCRHHGVQTVQADASFLDSRTLRLRRDGEEERLAFESAIVAVGSRPAIPEPLACDDPRVMDSAAALELEEIPRRLLVVGGGYIGLELGQVYASLGSAVTLVELEGDLLPGVDADLVAPLQERVERDFRALYLSTRTAALAPGDAGIRVRLDGPGVEAEQIFDRVLVATGRRIGLDGLGLGRTEVETDERGFPETDDAGRTADSRILAVGDVAGPPMLAHKGVREGETAAEAVAGRTPRARPRAIPAVVFTDPEIAWCGATESGRGDLAVTRFPWSRSGRARTMGRTEGLTKLLFDPATDRIAGMGVAGAGAGELVSEGCLAVEMGCTAADLAGTVHPHPTRSETLFEAAVRRARHGPRG